MAKSSHQIELVETTAASDDRPRGVGTSAGGYSKGPLGLAEGVTKGLLAAAEADPRVLAVLEDLAYPGLDWWVKNAPDRMVEVGIAEQNGAVVAAGLAAEGYIPVVYGLLFACISRAYNQIRQSILVDRFNVKFIAREGAWGEWGVSHNTIEGVGIMRVLPNLVILNPADAVEAEKAAIAMLQYVGPVVLRQEASPAPMQIFADSYEFTIGRAYLIKEGADATIIATGYMVTEAIRAAAQLEADGLEIGVLNMSTLKPLDEEAVIKVAGQSGAVVTAENASVIGGLGDAVAAVLGENRPTPMMKVGVEDEFSQSGLFIGDRDELKEHFGLTSNHLADAVRRCIARKTARS